MIKISACIITFNEEQAIEDCLKSVGWCEEIIVVDSGSTDQTVEICKSMGCKVIYNKFVCFSSQRQFASSQASNDWILFIDADERLTPSLVNEFRNITEDKIDDFVAYNIRFQTYIYGKLMRSCGLKNEKHVRFYNRKYVAFSDRVVHESLIINGPVGKFDGHIVHLTYADLHDHLEKLNRYTEMWSNEKIAKGKTTTIFNVFIQFPVKFFQFYILRGGVIDGFAGFVYSFFYGVYGTMKYAKLYQKQNR